MSDVRLLCHSTKALCILCWISAQRLSECTKHGLAAAWQAGVIGGWSPQEAWAAVGQCEAAAPNPTSPLHWMRGAERQGKHVSERFPAKTGTEMILFYKFLHGCLYLEIIPEQVMQCLAVPWGPAHACVFWMLPHWPVQFVQAADP